LLAIVLAASWLCAMVKLHSLWPGAVGGIVGAFGGRQPAVYDRAEGVYRWIGGMAGGFIGTILAVMLFTDYHDSRVVLLWSMLFGVVSGALAELVLQREQPTVPRGPWLHRDVG
jgi:hypothetical protein